MTSVALCALLAAGISACAWQRQAPVCRLDLNLDLFPPWQPRPADLDPAVFSGLLLRGSDMDCTGRPLFDPRERLAPLQPSRVQLTQHGDDWLVWLQTHAAKDGTVVGPVAQVTVGYERLEVRTLGQLCAASQHVELQLSAGPGGEVLEARSNTCATAAAGANCGDEVQLLVVRNHRFVALPGGTVPLRRRHSSCCGRSCQRTTTLEAEVERATSAPWTYVVREQLTVEEQAGAGGAAAPRTSKKSRTLVLDGNGWRSEAPSLGERIQLW